MTDITSTPNSLLSDIHVCTELCNHGFMYHMMYISIIPTVWNKCAIVAVVNFIFVLLLSKTFSFHFFSFPIYNVHVLKI